MSWPAQSTDLNLIELVWDELEQKVKTKQPTSAARFLHLLQENWAELSSVYLWSLVKRMSGIREAVITAKEGYFDESSVRRVGGHVIW